MTAMNAEIQPCMSHLIRLQFVNSAEGPVWRVSMQQIGQTEFRYFRDVSHYFAYLTQQLEQAVANPQHSESASYTAVVKDVAIKQ